MCSPLSQKQKNYMSFIFRVDLLYWMFFLPLQMYKKHLELLYICSTCHNLLARKIILDLKLHHFL